MPDEEQFIDYILNTLGLKGKNDYVSRFRLICRYFCDKTFDYEGVMRYKQWLKNQGKAPQTVNNLLKVIKHICDYCRLKNLTFDKEILTIKYEKKVRVTEKEWITEDQIKLIANAKIQFFNGPFKLKRIENNKLNLKWKVMILLLACGMRINEVVLLNWAEVWSDKVLAHGKSGDRIVSIPEKLYKMMLLLERYPHGFVVGSRQGKLYDRRANQIIDIKIGLTGIKKNITSHCFRHSYIMNNILAGESIAVIAEQVGHKSWDTTRQYSHLTHEHTKKQIEGYKVFRKKTVDSAKEALIEKIMKTNDKTKLQALSALI